MKAELIIVTIFSETCDVRATLHQLNLMYLVCFDMIIFGE